MKPATFWFLQREQLLWRKCAQNQPKYVLKGVQENWCINTIHIGPSGCLNRLTRIIISQCKQINISPEKCLYERILRTTIRRCLQHSASGDLQPWQKWLKGHSRLRLSCGPLSSLAFVHDAGHYLPSVAFAELTHAAAIPHLSPRLHSLPLHRMCSPLCVSASHLFPLSGAGEHMRLAWLAEDTALHTLVLLHAYQLLTIKPAPDWWVRFFWLFPVPTPKIILRDSQILKQMYS